jgi:chlorite dismutase
VEGQYVAYTFYRVDPAWRRLPVEERRAGKDAFAEVVEELGDRFDHLRAYSTAGVRPETDFFLWKISDRYEALGELGAALNATPLAGWLETPYSYLATTKASQYTQARKARKVVPAGLPYLVVYPFIKVRPWYALAEDDRQRAMNEHIRIGREEFPGIKNHTTYSFGIDDQEFMTAFECEEPADFMHLMLRLRDSEASAYTERDTPIFVGRHVTIREALAELDGAHAVSGALTSAAQCDGLPRSREREKPAAPATCRRGGFRRSRIFDSFGEELRELLLHELERVLLLLEDLLETHRDVLLAERVRERAQGGVGGDLQVLALRDHPGVHQVGDRVPAEVELLHQPVVLGLQPEQCLAFLRVALRPDQVEDAAHLERVLLRLQLVPLQPVDEAGRVHVVAQHRQYLPGQRLLHPEHRLQAVDEELVRGLDH